MTTIPRHFQIPFTPFADDQAVVFAPHVRFTVLTSRLIRLEYSPSEQFNNRPSQAFWYRQQPVPKFTVNLTGDGLEIITDHLYLQYTLNKVGFTPDTLKITLKAEGVTWHYGDPDETNLGGTCRTLDRADGAIPLEPGLLSQQGWVLVDDSHTLVFNDHAWLEPRLAAPEVKDLYFFGYGQAYQDCLRDYTKITGGIPLIPRWVLGNWWSRYWAYTQIELTELIESFQVHDIPLSVCIIDMDWHLAGWTGYTWNKDLFPNPSGFLTWLHQKGLKTALNLHPAAGIGPHEEMYPEMARHLDVDPQTEATIPFDIADPQFAQAYFEVLHHPQEAEGIDFWWMDWQQGEVSGLPGLDPLWWLNHLHYYDLGRPQAEAKETKRPFIFSRWGGLGNHRYPIGFSGDTQVTWASLAFQPYLTATSANVAYSWWSHDIGGHMMGVEESELYARWVQYGVFSPIMRLHSTKNAFHERRPWKYDAETFKVAKHAMQLRHALIPYLYTMAWRNSKESLALTRPLYHLYPQQEAAYHCPQQYMFGTELLVAPFTTPADEDTRLTRQVVWLPAGDWYNFFSGEYFPGDAWHAIYGHLSDVPVFAKAGAIIPLGPSLSWGGIDNPAEIHLHIFAGADNQFVLYEDDGESMAYHEGAYGLTTFEQIWRDQKMVISGGAVAGKVAHIPAKRRYHLYIHGVTQPQKTTLTIDDKKARFSEVYDSETETLHLAGMVVPPTGTFKVTLSTTQPTLLAHRDRTQEKCLAMLHAFKLETTAKEALSNWLDNLTVNPHALVEYAACLSDSQIQALLEVTQGVGFHHISGVAPEDLLILWNNRHQEGVTYHYSQFNPKAWPANHRFSSQNGPVPQFKVIKPHNTWDLVGNYFGVLQIKLGEKGAA